MDLFSDQASLNWTELGDSRIGYCPVFVTEHRQLYSRLANTLDWHQPEVSVYGKRHKTPRLTAFQGDVGLSYRYSGVEHQAAGWDATLQSLKMRIDSLLGTGFNTVLLNWYRDGADSMGYHADDEPELGKDPVIASISLGAERRCMMKPRDKSKTDGKNTRHIVLAGGSLLVMAGRFQSEWLHAVPKDAGQVSGRINLTFRQILV